MHRLATLSSVLAFGALLFGCADDPGHFMLTLEWEKEPQDEIIIWVWVEERSDPQVSGNIVAFDGPWRHQPVGWFSMDVGPVPYGSNRVVVVEVRATAEAAAPLLYYGISAPFSLDAGEDTAPEVPVYLKSIAKD